MASEALPRFRGVFPVVPTTFAESGSLDLESQKRCVDFMIDAGSNGLCILANFSEQFSLTDEERTTLTTTILEHVAGRVPIIVTTSHFSTEVCIRRSRHAQALGAAMVMVLPPFFGATIRVGEAQIYEFFAQLSDNLRVPIMLQDAPISGTMLSAPFLAHLAKDVEQLAYFKIETPGAATKLKDLISIGGAAIEGPWDGEEAITLIADLDAGITGTMCGGGFPDGIRKIFDAYTAGQRDVAIAQYARWLPLINYENRQGGILTAKALMKEGGVISSDAARHPLPAMRVEIRRGLFELARALSPLVFQWAK